MQEPLQHGETEWQAYIQKMLQGGRMGGPSEVEAWAMGCGYRVKVYRETKHGAGYRKIQGYGEEKEIIVGILWKKTRVYEVVWGQEEGVKRSTAREGDREGLCRGVQARVSVGSEGGHSVAYSESRPSTCGAGSVGSTEGKKGNEAEQQRKAAWAWKRREEALEGAREKTGDAVHMYGRDVNSMWEVLCALEGRPNSEAELQKTRQGVATRVESRHNLGAMEECLPREEVSWQKYIRRTGQGRGMEGPPEVEALAAEGGYKVAAYRESKSGNSTGNWWSMGTEPCWMQKSCGPGDKPTGFCGVLRVPGATRRRWRQRCKGYRTMHKAGRNGQKKCWTERGDRSYQQMASAYIRHSGRWAEQAGKQRRTRCTKH